VLPPGVYIQYSIIVVGKKKKKIWLINVDVKIGMGKETLLKEPLKKRYRRKMDKCASMQKYRRGHQDQLYLPL